MSLNFHVHSRVGTMFRFLVAVAVCLGSGVAWGQSSQTPHLTPPRKTVEVPVSPPTQYQTVQVPVQSPVQYQTVQVPVQSPVQYQTVQTPVQYQAASSVQTLSTQSRGQHTVTLGPGPVSLSLAWVGQRLAGLNKTHVWTIDHSVLRSSVAQAPVYQTVQTQAYAPVQYQSVQVPVQQQQQPQQQQQSQGINAPSEAAPPPPVAPTPPKNPSPQTGMVGKGLGGLLGWK